MISADSYMRMGSIHTICQDYTLAGCEEGITYAIVSDGCSGSPTGEPGSPFTDWGARFLARSTVLNRHLAEMASGHFPDGILNTAIQMTNHCRFVRTALDATLVAAVQCPDGYRVYQCGDGVVASRKDGRIKYTTIKFGNNMPRYLSYRLAGELKLADYFDEVKTIEIIRNEFVPGTGWLEPKSEICDVSSVPDVRTETIDPDSDVILVMSDGVESFVDGNNNSVPLERVLDQLFDFKKLGGPFITRRCNFFSKFCAKNGWNNTDDFSIAGISLS